jgi:hypothetical protein
MPVQGQLIWMARVGFFKGKRKPHQRVITRCRFLYLYAYALILSIGYVAADSRDKGPLDKGDFKIAVWSLRLPFYFLSRCITVRQLRHWRVQSHRMLMVIWAISSTIRIL